MWQRWYIWKQSHTHIHTHSGQIAIQVFHNESLFPLVLKTPSAIKIIEEKIRFYFVRANYACHELFSPLFSISSNENDSTVCRRAKHSRNALSFEATLTALSLIVGDKILLRLNETLQKPKKNQVENKFSFCAIGSTVYTVQ